MFYHLEATNNGYHINLIFGTMEGLERYIASNPMTNISIKELTEEEFNKIAGGN